jgi:glutaredoxin 2
MSLHVLKAEFDAFVETCATKADLEAFATKADLEAFATKADLEAFATKADLEAFFAKMDAFMKTFKEDIEHTINRVDARMDALETLIHSTKAPGYEPDVDQY